MATNAQKRKELWYVWASEGATEDVEDRGDRPPGSARTRICAPHALLEASTAGIRNTVFVFVPSGGRTTSGPVRGLDAGVARGATKVCPTLCRQERLPSKHRRHP